MFRMVKFVVSAICRRYGRAILDIDVAYDTDLDLAMETIKTVADRLWEEQLEEATIVEEPVISGVQNFGADAVTIRLSVRTEPLSSGAPAEF